MKQSANFKEVCFPNLTLWYSYETVIAFRSNGEFAIRENDWSVTTGKHLNWIDDDKSKRISGTEFEKKLNKVLKRHKLS